MAKLVVATFTSIDGVIQSPLSADEDRAGEFVNGGWVTPYIDESVADFMRNVTVSAHGLLLGGRTYSILANVWSTVDEREPAVAVMNQMPKYVVSRTVPLSWENSERVDDYVGRGLRELKADAAGDLVVFGSGTLVASLAEHDLVDEYRLLVFPVILGPGKRMFNDYAYLAHFELAETTSSPSGVVMLTYARAT